MPTETHIHHKKQHLEREVRQLAKLQKTTLEAHPLKSIESLLNKANETLTETYKKLARAAKKNRELTTAGEWLIDNFYIIQEQIVQLKEDLPPSYYKKLPRLIKGEYVGFPRVYEIVQVVAAVNDNLIDQDNIIDATKAYQQKQTLSLGEMWAVPLMIRFTLIMRLSELGEKLIRDRRIFEEVNFILETHLNADTDEPGYLLRKLSEIVDQQHDTERFLTVFAQRLQAIGMLSENERRWFDYKFARWETNLDEQLRRRTRQTSRLHLSVQNAISSLRKASETDWSNFVETCSVVERILRFDPANVYASMDFQSRDAYRKQIEKLASYSSFSQQQIAEEALKMAENEAQGGMAQHGQKMHIGYFLFGKGLQQLCRRIQYQAPFNERMMHKMRHHFTAYIGLTGLITFILLLVVALFTNLLSAPIWLIVVTLLAAMLPAFDLAIVSVNRLISLLVPPDVLPKIEFKAEIPHSFRTVVVVPTIFSSEADVKEQIEMLEIRALANSNPSLQFILLSDFSDAPRKEMPDDEHLLKTARYHIDRLNTRHKSVYGDKFMLFHRHRRWNEQDHLWMGWERKRGKIEELNKVLSNKEDQTSFYPLNQKFLSSLNSHPVTFVITLDADTKLPPGSARILIGTAAHPLNRPQIGEGNFVKSGYGIFQPRISIPPQAANKTWFTRIFSGNVGLDPYTTAVSDIYQDLYGEGVFVGKGLYDLQAFDRVLGDRFPSNTILSHDLLESTYLRCALVTDVELFDDFPTTYLNYSKRNHRWIRGDWQIVPWLFKNVPTMKGGRERNPINSISKWKIVDNLRRSLNPAALILFLMMGWLLLPGSALIWTAAAFGVSAFPIYSSFSTDIFRRPANVRWRLYFEKMQTDLKMNTVQALSNFIFLPHQAYLSIDAIMRTLWRMMLSRKKLLEWTSSIQTEKERTVSYWGYWKKMWFNIFWGFLSIVLVSVVNPMILVIVIPVSIAWICGPLIAFEMRQEPKQQEKALHKKQYEELKLYARRTWHFFEQYMTEEQNWLPPDNVQQNPYLGPVNRTSPTNMGLSLASVYVAYERGYITLSALLETIGNSLDSMLQLERYRGHFYNWYRISDRHTLHPKYLSTVDSGNLAASLIVIQQALEQLHEKQWPNPNFWSGLEETLDVIAELSRDLEDSNGNEALFKALHASIKALKSQIPTGHPRRLSEWNIYLKKLEVAALKLCRIDISNLRTVLEEAIYNEWKDWLNRPYKQISEQLNELRAVEVEGDYSTLEITTLNKLQSFSYFHEKLEKGTQLALVCQTLVHEMDFELFYNRERKLFSIGFNEDHAALDKSFYDLLASEARLASFIAIAKGDVPSSHWFKLSRRLTSIRRNEILLSWSGTMFEYLMPLLFMGRFDKTLLSNTYDHVVEWQKNYGNLRNHPWGVSESAFNMVNMDLHYQYKGFGVPGLGLRRGLAEDYVVAPYASLLALMVDPGEAFRNLKRLENEGVYGLNGFYEAIDYTPKRAKENGDDEKRIVKMYMAHHQGMGLLSLSNVLDNNLIQQLFHDHPLVKSCELLLQEKIPRGVRIKEPRPIDIELEPAEDETVQIAVDYSGIDSLKESPPRTQLLSNGRFSTLITNTGSGYSSFEETALTRWRADGVIDPYGTFFYLKDLETQDFWSVGYQPVRKKPDRYDSWFHAGVVQIAQVNNWIESFMEVCVSPEDDIEFRKIILTNYAKSTRTLELTSYSETVLNTRDADRSHPAFSNLFVQTEYAPEQNVLLARRRLRAPNEQPAWLMHMMVSEDIEEMENSFQFETDRAKFIGRARSPSSPRALDADTPLSRSVGNIPDPIMSLRQTITLKPGEKKQITFGMGYANTREEAIEMADRYDNLNASDRVFELAAIYGSVELDHIGISGEQVHYFQKLAGSLIYGNENLRAKQSIMKRNRRTQAALWAYGISGDLPLLVYHISDGNYIREVSQLLKAHALWRQKGLKVDLIIINDHPASYIDELQEAIEQEIQLSLERGQINAKGGIFALRADQMEPEIKTLIDTLAHVVLSKKLPKIDVENEEPVDAGQASKEYHRAALSGHHKSESFETDDLLFFNGYGGFTKDGKEYVIRLQTAENGHAIKHPPAPWINVITNPQFGFITTDNGSDHTWSVNSRENKLTPWSNNSVNDPSGEVLYVRDEDEGLFWCPTPGPLPGSRNYEIRHGFGYTGCYNKTLNIEQQVLKWVAKDDPIKIIKLQLTNTDLRMKQLSVFRYVEWVLGVFREDSARQIITSYNKELQSVFARNYYNNEFAGRVAFASFYTDHPTRKESYTADRSAFIGRNRGLEDPHVLHSINGLNERFGMGFDPCAGSKVEVELASGSSLNLYFFLGEAQTQEEAKRLIKKYRSASVIADSLKEVRNFWDKKLTRLSINTPVQEFDILVNGWLQYQNIACRMWGRTGFYQSGGAFGFRDQLQDSTAACYLDPKLTRKQILLHAAHQFPEGDVLHWWHPPTDRGIRSRITDDLLWLPYATSFYIHHTGDETILNERTNFLNARLLERGEHEAYLHPQKTDEFVDLYEHCCLTIDRSLTKGPHNLPLIGAGDWNDGMNSVGDEGKGESVWLGFFLYHILESFIPICRKRKDEQREKVYRNYQKELKVHLNKEGWDGEWFRRAYYDDGTPLGSKENRECRIDAIAQAWSVISGAADPAKKIEALQSADRHLVSEEDGIIKLLTPAFDTTKRNPGYIKGYIPGVRENGGQYTHGALWLVKAFAESGQRNRAVTLMKMLTPINHTKNTRKVDRYFVEPYAVAADVYGEPPLTGMGGWTWYTGSAGWMYRVILESILGVEIQKGNEIHVNPYKGWRQYAITLKDFDGNTTYHLKVQNNGELNAIRATLDGAEMEVQNGTAVFPMQSDGKSHQLLVETAVREKV